MKDMPEIHESPEKQIIKTPEKKIGTFDDLRTSDESEQINTFDDVTKGHGSDKSIQTFDDFTESKERITHQQRNEGTEKRTSVNDSPENIEQKRLIRATEDIKKMDWMKPEKWKTLSINEKRIAIEHCGRALGNAYHSPEPPLITKHMEAPGLQGEYGDGFSYDAKNDRIVGSDYGIRMNEEGFDYETNKKLFGDDPKVALEAYTHEFRHSYQNEQAHAFDKGFRTDNPDKAREWSENLKDYKQPPDAELAKTDPEKYFKEYEAYRNQPVERDAREFGSEITRKVYENNSQGKG